MTDAASLPSPRRLVTGGMISLALVAALAGCGSSAPASTAPSQAAPASVAPASIAPVATPSPTSAATATPAGSSTAAVDPAEGLKIDPPYSLVALPDALQQLMGTQMASALGGFGSTVQVGFRQVSGGTGQSIVMVMAFPTGFLNDAAYQAALAGMGSSTGATFTTTTIDGVVVSSGKSATGGLGVFHIADHMIMVIAQTDTETVPVATALIKANQ